MTSENAPDAGDQPDPAAEAGEHRLGQQVERTGMFGIETTGDTSGYGGLQVRRPDPPSTARPYGSYYDEIADRLAEGLERDGAAFAEAVSRVVVERGELTLHVPREHLVAVARLLRDEPSLAFRDVPGRQRGPLPLGHRPRTARRLPAAVDHPQPPGPP